MSENIQTSETKNDAKARAAADKAYTKASRPWFKKKRFILPLIIVLIIIIVNLGGNDDSDSSSDSAAAPVAESQNASAAAAPAEEEAPAQDPGLTFSGAQKSDVIGVGGDALTLGKITVTTTPLVDGDAVLGATLCTNATVQNTSDKVIDFNIFDWKMQAPSGTISNTGFSGSANLLSTGQVAPGGSATGDVCFDSSAEAGQYVVIYEPVLSFFSDRGAWINNR